MGAEARKEKCMQVHKNVSNANNDSKDNNLQRRDVWFSLQLFYHIYQYISININLEQKKYTYIGTFLR